MLIALLIITPVLASLLSIVTPRSVRLFSAIAILARMIEAITVVALVGSVVVDGSYSALPLFNAEPFGTLLAALLAVVGLAVSFYSVGYFEREVAKEIVGLRRVQQYFVLLQLFMAAMYTAVLTTSPMIMWMAIEATTLSTVFLISFYNKPTTVEAAWKYLLINSIGLLLGFFGMLLYFTGLPQVGDFGAVISWQTLIAAANQLDPTIAKVAFAFVLIGYGTKMGLVPMHTWLPDAHSKAPTPVSSLLSGLLLNIALYAIMRYKFMTDIAVGEEFTSNLLIVFGVLSVAVAAFMILVQRNYKRLLAYSSIEHMGLIALGIGLGGNALHAAFLHLVYHTLTKTILFLSAGNIFLQFSSTKIANVRGMLQALPLTSVLFVLGALAITGTPPFGTFITEFTILAQGIQSYPFAVVVVLVALSIVFIGFLGHVSQMLLGQMPDGVTPVRKSAWRLAPIMTLMGILIWLSISIPAPVQTLFERIVATI